MKITIGIDGSGAGEALKNVFAYRRWLEERTQELVKRLAERGKEVASVSFQNALYDGVNDVEVNVEQRGEKVCAVVATGNAALFIEFGTGVYFPNDHPEPMPHGTYGQGHGNDPYWWYTGQPGNAGGTLAQGRRKDGTVYTKANTTITHGNPPSASMYNARKQLTEEIYEIAREVFSH